MGAHHVCHAQQTVIQQVWRAQCVSVTRGIRGQTQLTLPLPVMVSELLYIVHFTYVFVITAQVKGVNVHVYKCVREEPVKVL